MPPLFGDVKYAAVAAESDGDNTVVAAVSGKKLRVLGYALTVDVTGKITVQDNTSTPVVLATLHVVAGTPATYSGGGDCPAFETAEGKGLEISNPAGTNTYGHIAYQEV